MSHGLPAFRFSGKTERTSPQPINYLLQLALGQPDLISLAAGLVDQQTLPAREVRQLACDLLDDEQAGQQALQYGETEGASQLREALVGHVCALDGVTPADTGVGPANVVIASGSQQLLYIVADVMVDPGDIVITEWPSYFVFTSALTSLGASICAVDMDEQGMRTDALASALDRIEREGRLDRVKLLYTCDYYQNPTGITLSLQRRREMLDIVRAYSKRQRICLLEDAAYRELSCDDPPPASIKSLEPENAQVVLAQTFSKPFAPGLRSGYAVLPDDLVGAVLDQKGNHDFGSSNLAQHLLLRALTGSVYADHVVHLRRRYRAKRDAMLSALAEHLGDFEPDQTHWTRPGGGLYVWLTLPERLDTGKDGALFAAALDEGVIYVPGAYCYGPDPQRRVPVNHIRLSYGSASDEAIFEGVARLSRAVRKVAGHRGPRDGPGDRQSTGTP